jgi:hypothetical protein
MTFCNVHGEQEPGSQVCPICGNKLGKRPSVASLLWCVLIAGVLFFAWLAIEHFSGMDLPPMPTIFLLLLAASIIAGAAMKLFLLVYKHSGAIKSFLIWAGVFVIGVLVWGIAAKFGALVLGCSIAMAVLILLVAYIAFKK